MLLKIREKSQGVFSWFILLLICVPFALWGIQNYIGGGSEAAIATVGDTEFYQQDVNAAYAQYSQNLRSQDFDEEQIKRQALEKLIRDEVLLQYVQDEGLVITDETARSYIKSLEYFQQDGRFNQLQYKSLLASQRMTEREFVARIKKALVMEQFQRSVTESAFVTPMDIENFFRIQNQKRDVEIISIPLQKSDEQPTENEIASYYQQNQDLFLTEEQVSIEYVELALDELAKQITPTEEQLRTHYEDQKDLYTTKERRKISHILFSFTKDSKDDEKQLARAIKAKQALQDKEFSVLAAELSDDKVTASKGGDLGLFNAGVMEKAFEDAVALLKLGEVSDPVKSAFGYHLIKVTELVPGETKSFEEVKQELTLAFQRLEAENSFYELSETLTEISYENPDSLQGVAEALEVEIKKTGFFGKKVVENNTVPGSIVTETAVINAAFSADVLKGNNSEPVEIGSDRLLVLRMMEHKPASVKKLDQVKMQIITSLENEKAKQLTLEKGTEIKNAVLKGDSMQKVAADNNLKVEQYSALTRANGELKWPVNQAVFKAAKPIDGKSIPFTVADSTGAQTVVRLLAVTEGVMSESDKAKQELAETNISKAFGQAEFNAILDNLQANADISVNIAKK